jgi:hypothetical protein
MTLWQDLLRQANELKERTRVRNLAGGWEERLDLWHELTNLVVRIADDPDYQGASDEARGGPAEAVLNEVLRHVPLNLPSARRLLKKVPDRAGWLFSNSIEVLNVSRTTHFEDPDAYFRVRTALEEFIEHEIDHCWVPDDDPYLERDYQLSDEGHVPAAKFFVACLHNLANCRPPAWLERDIGRVLRQVRPLVRRFQRTRDLFVLVACIVMIKQAVDELLEELEDIWPKDEEVAAAITKEDDDAVGGS